MEENKIVIYQTEDGQTQIDVRLENDTVWLTQAQMVDLFKSSRTNILEHIQHIYEDDELDEISTCRKFRQVQKEGNRMVHRTKTMYNLDMIISVGYRVNTKRGIRFRQWANRVLKEFIIKGYVMDDERLKGNHPFGADYFEDLLERISEIRRSERSNCQKITDIYAEFSCDYDCKSDITKAFYKTMCNMMQKDKDLNLLTASFLGIAERRAHQHLLTTMTEWNELLINKTV